MSGESPNGLNFASWLLQGLSVFLQRCRVFVFRCNPVCLFKRKRNCIEANRALTWRLKANMKWKSIGPDRHCLEKSVSSLSLSWHSIERIRSFCKMLSSWKFTIVVYFGHCLHVYSAVFAFASKQKLVSGEWKVLIRILTISRSNAYGTSMPYNSTSFIQV